MSGYYHLTSRDGYTRALQAGHLKSPVYVSRTLERSQEYVGFWGYNPPVFLTLDLRGFRLRKDPNDWEDKGDYVVDSDIPVSRIVDVRVEEEVPRWPPKGWESAFEE